MHQRRYLEIGPAFGGGGRGLTGLDPAHTGMTSPRGGDPVEVLKAHVQPRIYTPEELSKDWRNFPGGMKNAPPNQRALQVVSASRLPTTLVSAAKLFKANGYRTGHFGKWHMGPEPFSPIEHGFDVDVPHVNSAGPMGGHLGPWRDWPGENRPQNKGRNIDDCLADHAIKFIEENKNHPFYLNFWVYGVHVPIQARQDFVEYFQTKAPKSGQNNPVYAAMIKSTDAAIGRLWKSVEDAGLAEEPILVFYSDNGGVNYGTPQITDNSPLRGGKGDIYEGGVRVPGFVVWPGVTKAQSTCDLPINARDMLPTFVDMCGFSNLPKFDGRSVVPALAGKPMEARPIFTHLPHYGGSGEAPATSVMFDGWKLIRRYYQGTGRAHGYELYNLKEDPGETLNYWHMKPEIVARLDGLIEDYIRDTNAVVPISNPAYKEPARGELDGISYEILPPQYLRGVKFPLVVCMEGEDNPAYADLQQGHTQWKHSMYLMSVKYPRTSAGGDERANAMKVANLIDKVVRDYQVQPRSIYLTGKDLGATRVWNLLAVRPELFAGALPVGGNAAEVPTANAKNLRIWAFHQQSGADVSAVGSVIAGMKAKGVAGVNYTPFSAGEAVRLDNVWSDPAVLAWIFGGSKEPGKPLHSAIDSPDALAFTDYRSINVFDKEDDFDPDDAMLSIPGVMENLLSLRPESFRTAR